MKHLENISEELRALIDTGEFDFIKDIPNDQLWKLMLIPAYVTESIFDKIRAEIEALPRELPTDARNMIRKTRVLDIIDKYR